MPDAYSGKKVKQVKPTQANTTTVFKRKWHVLKQMQNYFLGKCTYVKYKPKHSFSFPKNSTSIN